MTNYVEIEDEDRKTKTSSCDFKFVDLEILVSVCERLSTLILILICPEFLANAVLIVIGKVLRLQYLVLYRLGFPMPAMLDYYIAFFCDRLVTVLQMFFGWPSFWYIVIMVGLCIISTIGTACNTYSMYCITRNERADIDEKRLLAIEAIRGGAANSAELYDFVVYHSDHYRNYLQYYDEETSYRLSYTRIREELNLPGEQLV